MDNRVRDNGERVVMPPASPSMTDAEFKTLIARIERDVARTRVAVALLAAFVFGMVVMAVIFNVAAL